METTVRRPQLKSSPTVCLTGLILTEMVSVPFPLHYSDTKKHTTVHTSLGSNIMILVLIVLHHVTYIYGLTALSTPDLPILIPLSE